MNNPIHHVHIFASDIDRSIEFYEDPFDGKIVLDRVLAGARNVFMKTRKGRIHPASPRWGEGKGEQKVSPPFMPSFIEASRNSFIPLT